MAPPLGQWPTFTLAGALSGAGGETKLVQAIHTSGVQGEEYLARCQDGNLKLFLHHDDATYLCQKTHGTNLTTGWSLVAGGATPQINKGGTEGSPDALHTDTPAYLEHPVTGEHLMYYGQEPGTRAISFPSATVGAEGSIGVATRTTIPIPSGAGTAWTQTHTAILTATEDWENGFETEPEPGVIVIRGGLLEPTAVWNPHTKKVRLFYIGMTARQWSSPSSPGPFTWAISYADSTDGKTGWVKRAAGPFWDSDINGNPAQTWLPFRGSWQPHVFPDYRADGVHMVLNVTSQSIPGGGRVAHYWSEDWGDTWERNPNVLIIPGIGASPVPAGGYQRTPAFWIDERFSDSAAGGSRYVLLINGGDGFDEEGPLLPRKTYALTASRPAPTTLGTVRSANYSSKQRASISTCTIPLPDQAIWTPEMLAANPPLLNLAVADAEFTTGLTRVQAMVTGPRYASGNPRYLKVDYKTEILGGVANSSFSGYPFDATRLASRGGYRDKVLTLTNAVVEAPFWAKHANVDLAGTRFDFKIPYPAPSAGTKTLSFTLNSMTEYEQEAVPQRQVLKAYRQFLRYMPASSAQASFYAELLIEVRHQSRVVPFWLTYGNSDIQSDSSPRWTGTEWTLPGNITAEIEGPSVAVWFDNTKLDAAPSVVGSTTTLTLISTTRTAFGVVFEPRFGDGYSQAIRGVLLYTGGSPTQLELDTMAAETEQHFEAISQNWPDHGTFSPHGFVLKRPTNSLIATDTGPGNSGLNRASQIAGAEYYTYRDRTGRDPWFGSLHDHTPLVSSAGANNEWGTTRASYLARSGLADMRALALSVYQTACRPHHFRYVNGDAIDHANHTGKSGLWSDLMFWYSRPFFGNGPVYELAPPYSDGLGKLSPAPTGPEVKEGIGARAFNPNPPPTGTIIPGEQWGGPRDEHWPSLWFVAYALMSGDRWCREEAKFIKTSVMAQLWPVCDFAFDPHPMSNPSSRVIAGIHESRGDGRMLLAMCGLYWLTGDERIRTNLNSRMQNVYDVSTPYIGAWGWDGRTRPRTSIRLLRFDQVLQYPFGGCNFWESAIAATAFIATHRVTEDSRWRNIAKEIAYTTTTHPIRRNADSETTGGAPYPFRWDLAVAQQHTPYAGQGSGVPLLESDKTGVGPSGWKLAANGFPFAIWHGASLEIWTLSMAIIGYQFAIEEGDQSWASRCVELIADMLPTQEQSRGPFGWGNTWTNNEYDWFGIVEDIYQARSSSSTTVTLPGAAVMTMSSTSVLAQGQGTGQTVAVPAAAVMTMASGTPLQLSSVQFDGAAQMVLSSGGTVFAGINPEPQQLGASPLRPDYWLSGSRLYFQRLVDGVAYPMIDMGTVDPTSPALTPNIASLVDSDGGIGRTIDQSITRIDESYSLRVRNLNPENWSLYFLAEPPESWGQAADIGGRIVPHFCHPERLLKLHDGGTPRTHLYGCDAIYGVVVPGDRIVTKQGGLFSISRELSTLTMDFDWAAEIAGDEIAGAKIIVHRYGLANAGNARTYTITAASVEGDNPTVLTVAERPVATEIGPLLVDVTFANRVSGNGGSVLGQRVGKHEDGKDWEIVDLPRGLIHFLPGGSVFPSGSSPQALDVYFRMGEIAAARRLIRPHTAAGAIQGRAILVYGRKRNARQSGREMLVSITPRGATIQDTAESALEFDMRVLTDQELEDPMGRMLQYAEDAL